MQIQSMHFKARAGQKLADQRLQQTLKKFSTKFVGARASAITELDDFEATRDAAVERRMRAIDNLDVWLATFEKKRHVVVRPSSMRKLQSKLQSWWSRSLKSTTLKRSSNPSPWFQKRWRLTRHWRLQA